VLPSAFRPVACQTATIISATKPSEPVTPQAFQHITLVAHADWSKDPAKRWLALAILQPDQHWLVPDLYPARFPDQLFLYLKTMSPEPGCIIAGFDFPIGLPAAFASNAGLTSFLSALPRLGQADWAQFYLPAEDQSQISIYRPFYPARPGHSRHQHLEQALGIPFHQLYRLCETGHQNRRPVCPLFWTLGAQQVGKAAISVWQLLLSPNIGNPCYHLHLWPFSGTLSQLCLPGNLVVVETYPAEFYAHLGISFSTPRRRSKRRQADRQAFTPLLISWARQHRLRLSLPILEKINSGFSSSYAGEDQFDALVGLYGMINIIQGNHPFGEPGLPVISKIEGWIFGQEGQSSEYQGDRAC
jgi:hypothetical protein